MRNLDMQADLMLAILNEDPFQFADSTIGLPGIDQCSAEVPLDCALDEIAGYFINVRESESVSW